MLDRVAVQYNQGEGRNFSMLVNQFLCEFRFFFSFLQFFAVLCSSLQFFAVLCSFFFERL